MAIVEAWKKMRGLGVLAVVIGVSMLLAPAAHADPLSGVRQAVVNARAGTRCPPMNYSVALEGEAQHYIGNNLQGVPPAGQYVGTWEVAPGEGDPAEKAISAMVANLGHIVGDCSFQDFGVGFYRTDGRDDVIALLGRPPAPPAPPVQCDDGTTVPAGQQCPLRVIACPDGTAVPAGKNCPLPPQLQPRPSGVAVFKPTDIFNLPDGAGTPYLDKDGNHIFAPPREYALTEPCHNNWCSIQTNLTPQPPQPAWIYIGEGLGKEN